MHVLMISDHADPLATIGSKESGGQNVYVMNIAGRLAAQGHYVDVYTRWDAPSKQEVVTVKPRFRVIRVNAGPKAYMPRDDFLSITDDFVAEVKERITTEKLTYDIIFSNYWFSGIIGMELAEAYSLPQTHVYHSIGQIRFDTLKEIHPQEVDTKLFRLRSMWERRIAQRCNILTTSPVEQSEIRRLFGVDGSRITCVPIGVDMSLFKPRSVHHTRKKLGLPLGKPIVLYVGRIEWRKGIATLVRAMSKIADAELYIVGGGTTTDAQEQDAVERKRLTDIIDQLKLGARIHFIGAKPQEQAAKYYAAADVCAVPSYYEPFGIVPLEAMSCGTPVVASQTGGMQFTVTENITGHLARPNDHHDLAAKLSLVLERGRASYSEAAREHILQHFSWPKIAADTADYLLSLTDFVKSPSSIVKGVEAAEHKLRAATTTAARMASLQPLQKPRAS